MKLPKKDISELKKYVTYINFVGAHMPQSAHKLDSQINASPRNIRFFLATIVGVELLKEQMHALIVIRKFINEFSKTISKQGNGSITPYKKVERKYEKMTFGGVRCDFVKIYSGSLNKKLCDDLNYLNELRNSITHNIFALYNGDLHLANQAVKNYALSNKINDIMHILVELFNDQKKKTDLLNTQAKHIGII